MLNIYNILFIFFALNIISGCKKTTQSAEYNVQSSVLICNESLNNSIKNSHDSSYFTLTDKKMRATIDIETQYFLDEDEYAFFEILENKNPAQASITITITAIFHSDNFSDSLETTSIGVYPHDWTGSVILSKSAIKKRIEEKNISKFTFSFNCTKIHENQPVTDLYLLCLFNY